MYISEAITANALAVAILLCVLINAKGKAWSEGCTYKRLTGLIVFNMLLCVGETVSVLVDGQSFAGVTTVAMLINSMLHLISIIFAEKWLEFNFIRVLGENNFKRRKCRRVLLLAPIALAATLVVINLFHPILFRIDTETMLYVRMPLFPLVASLSYAYLAVGILLFFINRKKLQKYMMGSVIFFLLPAICASVLQMLFLGISIMWAGAALGILSMYLCMQDENALIDELSGVYSRSYLINYLKTRCGKGEKGIGFAGIMLDVDHFKHINDEHGHQVGDNVIYNIGHILRSSVPASVGFAARYGGDEFVVIALTSNVKELDAILADIRTNLDAFNKASGYPFPLIVSAGGTLFRKGDTLESFIQRMDAEMYKEKQMHRISEES